MFYENALENPKVQMAICAFVLVIALIIGAIVVLPRISRKHVNAGGNVQTASQTVNGQDQTVSSGNDATGDQGKGCEGLSCLFSSLGH